MNVNNRIFVVTALALMLAACQTTPGRNDMLEQTRAHLQSVQQDPQTSVLAPEELQRAVDSFGRAETAHGKGRSVGKVNQLSYLANRQVIMAQDAALSRSAHSAQVGAHARPAALDAAKWTADAPMPVAR